MAAISSIIAGVVALYGYASAEQSKQDAKNQAEKAAGEQRKAGAEQAAGNAAQAAAERRRQVREERVRRAHIMQVSEASGTVGSSGETGGIGNLATNLGSNLGANAGALQKSVAISSFNQQAADFSFASQQSMADAQGFQQLGQLGGNIFSASGGFQELGTRANRAFTNYTSTV